MVSIYQHSVLEDTRLRMESASEEGPPLKENCLVLSIALHPFKNVDGGG